MTLAATPPDEITDTETLVRVENLRIGFGDKDVVGGVGFELRRGEVLAVVGESGSGKSVTTRSLAGLAGAGARVRADRFDLFGTDATGYGERDWRRLRGNRIGLILQDALTALDPLRTITKEISEGLRDTPRRDRPARVDALLRTVGIDDPETRRRQRSFQLSGGQRQRALIAAALAGDPELLIADEPTTALDVTVQAQILDLIVGQARAGRAVILVSHDLAVVSSVADRVLVMKDGRIVEDGPVRRVIDEPAADYTRELIAAVPGGDPRPPLAVEPERAETVLAAVGLTKSYRVLGRPVVAVDDASFAVGRGEVLGIVGESGSGKSTIARMITGLSTPDAGELHFLGEPHPSSDARAGDIGLVAQDSVASFDPRYLVGEIIGEAVETVTADHPDRPAQIRRLLESVHLPAGAAQRHPRELSGGQRQRVNIARALATRPRLIVCDEPVSALDISVQAQILDLLHELTENADLSLVFISHDLAVVRRPCHRLVVLHRGRVVEAGDARDVFDAPRSPYTRTLLDAIPTL
ncbi:ABC transporter ATP-binding protein [Gordonia sp. ABSL11-1]|uniref:ATP-binding cassette domain-containing protein n=1 Tax=Gordonia sp. ABSL11-1 TaxID=3053924 RepID=UPI0025733F74|nr:ABC transporter ATP-binding protein [Gordonia sp. ABSL11-1]MDL9947938.1 ABC transporter ATP-binding protein [Gordonia sp. ABSL11-1]